MLLLIARCFAGELKFDGEFYADLYKYKGGMNKSYNREQLLSVLEKQGHSVAHSALFANAIEMHPSLLWEEFVCSSDQ
jgi:hypothetical protein